MEPRPALSPGHGRLCQGCHPDAAGHLHPALPAGEQVLPGGDRLPAARHGLDRQLADHSTQRFASFARLVA